MQYLQQIYIPCKHCLLHIHLRRFRYGQDAPKNICLHWANVLTRDILINYSLHHVYFSLTKMENDEGILSQTLSELQYL